MGLVVLIALACPRHWVCIYYICPQSLLTLLVQQSGSSGLNVYQRYSGVSVQQLLKSFILTVQRLPNLRSVDFSVSFCVNMQNSSKVPFLDCHCLGVLEDLMQYRA